MNAPSGLPELGIVRTDERRHLYWATMGFDFPTTPERVILPREWVSQSQLYAEVATDLEPARLAEIAARRGDFPPEPTLEKCVGEAVFEEVRLRVRPDAFSVQDDRIVWVRSEVSPL